MSATALVIYLVYRCHSINLIKTVIGTILTIFLIKYSRASEDKNDWIKRHCIWHYGSIILLLYFFNMIYNSM